MSAERPSRNDLQQFFAMLDAQLATHDFVAGNEFSIADITALVAVNFARVFKQKPDEQHPISCAPARARAYSGTAVNGTLEVAWARPG